MYRYNGNINPVYFRKKFNKEHSFIIKSFRQRIQLHPEKVSETSAFKDELVYRSTRLRVNAFTGECLNTRTSYRRHLSFR